MIDALTFTCTSPSHKASTKTVPLYDVVEPAEDWVVIYEQNPGYGLTAKDLGPGSPGSYTAEVDIEGDDYDDLMTEIAAWKNLKDGQGSVSYTLSNRTGSIAKCRMKSITVTPINPLAAAATLEFVEVL